MNYDTLIHGVTRAIELIGIAVLLIGGLIASLTFLRGWWSAGLSDSYQRFRANLGRAILLGLEILIAADIIGTVAVEPTLENLAVLGLIVLIRTFLSFALEIEINGRFPWRRKPGGDPHAPPEVN
jgi:uncharacterized membrane protein